MAPLGIYGAIGGKDVDNDQPSSGCENEIVNPKNSILNNYQLKEMSIGGTSESSETKQHLPFSTSRSNGVNGRSALTAQQQQQQQQQDLVTFNATITSMNPPNIHNTGRNYRKKIGLFTFSNFSGFSDVIYAQSNFNKITR